MYAREEAICSRLGRRSSEMGGGGGTADRRYICSKEVSSMAVVSWQGGQGQGEAEP